MSLSSTSLIPPDNQGDLPAGRPQGDLQPGGRHGARDQHARPFLPLPEPRGRLGVHSGVRAAGLRDHCLLLPSGSSAERGGGASRRLHHRLHQRHRWDFCCPFKLLLLLFNVFIWHNHTGNVLAISWLCVYIFKALVYTIMCSANAM